MTIGILLADDHPIVSDAVRQLLERESDLRILGVARSARELVDLAGRTSCDIVITDFSMPGVDSVDGLPLIATLRRRWPHLGIIVLTMISNPGVLQSILDVGANALINKADAMSELALAIRVISRDQRYVSLATRELLARAVAGPATHTVALSPREAEVIRLFASGKTVTDIAKHFNRSVKTVSTQKLEAMAKLGLKSDLEIYSYARENGLLS
ncbi:response regulator transcription factor [Pseudoxanthomonas indica]|uniref:Two component transcriptional regulator, LuxR family n=1 Tax=Pseudoxanthomonas indica TaxID=428993 RepID=A0A1T5JJV4_9GAMM|nr:response regulator transcription factor [Pseudoxanthomonas indica]GGD59243.1 DNA-binding response regulator [Pseudoxanthomonas indica]SKC51857.1 two component transcriptional regulator, LuxR family [Pseudoxanthomonas indica]